MAELKSARGHVTVTSRQQVRAWFNNAGSVAVATPATAKCHWSEPRSLAQMCTDGLWVDLSLEGNDETASVCLSVCLSTQQIPNE